jgi:hypothetical protein
MKPSDIIDILTEWRKERKRHSDKSFKEWLKHVGGLWTSKEEWAKLGKLETWKQPTKDTGKKIGKMFVVQVLTVILIIVIIKLGF